MEEKREQKGYIGYPEYVVLAMPKSGTKSVNKMFTNLGYKVHDIFEFFDTADYFLQYGEEKISFGEYAKHAFEDPGFNVIIEPAGVMWMDMVKHWPKTKFIQLVRDEDSWKKSFINFYASVFSIPPSKYGLQYVLANNPDISPTAYKGFKALQNYCRLIIGTDSNVNESLLYTDYRTAPPQFILRYYRVGVRVIFNRRSSEILQLSVKLTHQILKIRILNIRLDI